MMYSVMIATVFSTNIHSCVLGAINIYAHDYCIKLNTVITALYTITMSIKL